MELSDQFLFPILEASSKFLGPEELVRRVLPDKPDLLLIAACRLYPGAEGIENRKPLLHKALLLLGAESTPKLDELHTKALVLKELGQTTEAKAAFQALLARKPDQLTWRYELAELLYERGQFQEVRVELLTILAQDPKHSPAHNLFRLATQGLLKRK